MAWLPWDADAMFGWNNWILVGWLALIFTPRRPLTRYFVLAPAVFLCLSYGVILVQTLFHRPPNSPPLDFFNLTAWLALMRDPYFIVGTTAHFCVTDLWMGWWMVKDFYTHYTCGYNVWPRVDGSIPLVPKWTSGRWILTFILLVTYMVAPVGFLVYLLVSKIYFCKFATCPPIDMEQPRSVVPERLVAPTVSARFMSFRNIRFGDGLPGPIRSVYRFFLAIVGLVLAVPVVTVYLGYVVYCVVSQPKPAKSLLPENEPKFPPSSVRAHTIASWWTSVITPTEERDWLWTLRSYWLQICTFLMYIPSATDPLKLFAALQKAFAAMLPSKATDGVFAFGDGVGVGSYALVKKYLQSREPAVMKDFQSLGWSVSSSQAKFCDFTAIFLPNPSNPGPDELELSRKVVFKWLHNFPHELADYTRSDELNNKQRYTYDQLGAIIPRQAECKPADNVVYKAVGEAMFFLATGGYLRRDERDAYVDCVSNALIFFPDWFNFLLAGHYLENKNYGSYEKLQAAFARYADGPAAQAAIAAAGSKKSPSEVLRLIAIVFAIAGSAAPAKLAVSVIAKLWEGQDYVDMFHKNPISFIKECARMNKAVPMVNVISNANIAQDIKDRTGADLPNNTRIHCSIVSANHDPNVFTKPETFNPKRPELGKIIVWNGVEEEILNETEDARPPRYCPGHDLSLNIIKFVASRFAPILSSDSKQNSASESEQDSASESKQDSTSEGVLPIDREPQLTIASRDMHVQSQNVLDERMNRHYMYGLDAYTRLSMKLMAIAATKWNECPPRGVDVPEPCNLPNRELQTRRVDAARFVASWDEDEPEGASIQRQLLRKLLNSKVWPMTDLRLHFSSHDQMIAWRVRHFPMMPQPTNACWIGDKDDLMSKFAFYGLACHLTSKLILNGPSKSAHNRLDAAVVNHPKLKDNIPVYINDVRALGLFAVRAPYQRYGAAAYFNSKRELIAIYLCDPEAIVTPHDCAQQWSYAKYVWRSSAFALVTLREHLLSTHFIEANALTNASRRYLPASHPLRTFLKPFTYRTISINDQAAISLVNKGGLIHRIWDFDHEEFVKLCDYVQSNYQFRVMQDWIPASMRMDQFNTEEEKKAWAAAYPIAADAPKMWSIVHGYVRRFFNIQHGPITRSAAPRLPMRSCKQNTVQTEAEKEKEEEKKEKKEDKEAAAEGLINDTAESILNESPIAHFVRELCKPLGINFIESRIALENLLTQLICAATCIHEHVGQISDYLFDPGFIGTRIKQDGPPLASVQNYSQLLVLTSLTGMKMPALLDDWSHLIPLSPQDNDTIHSETSEPWSEKLSEADVDTHLKNYWLFKKQLTALAREIDERHRDPTVFPFQSFNPRFMQCSVSR